LGKTNPADSKNLIELGTRSLLVEDGKKLILIDCGLGNKQDEKFFGHYSLYGDESLDKNLKNWFCKRRYYRCFLHTFTSIIVVAQLNGMMTKQVTDLLLKMHNFGPMKIIGNGQQNLIQEKKQVS
jgi:hypothetical protein